MVEKNKIRRAKNAHLPQVLLSLGVKLIQQGQEFQLANHRSLKLFKHQNTWIYKWYSKNQTGDGVQFLQEYFAMSFNEAIETLTQTQINRHVIAYPAEDGEKMWTTEKWQQNSVKLIEQAHNNLFQSIGKKAKSYLMDQRGIQGQAMVHHKLGWLPAKSQMPSKIVIPSYNSKGQLLRIRFRIDKLDSQNCRYRIKKGSDPSFPFPLGISSLKPLLVVESELDAILAFQEAKDLISVIALGSTAINLSAQMIQYLNRHIPLILLALDNDDSGRAKTKSLETELHKTKNWPVPAHTGKDVGEAWKTLNIRQWVQNGLN
jgi:DNA primase